MADLHTASEELASASKPVQQLAPQCALGLSFLGRVAPGQALRAASILAWAQRVGATSLLLTDGQVMGPLSQVLSELMPELLIHRDELPVLALEHSLGAMRLARPRAALAALASQERDEAQAAFLVTEAALGMAAELGSPFVLLRPGMIGGLTRHWERARAFFLRGGLADDDDAIDELMAARTGLALRHLEALRRGLEQVANAAVRKGTTVLLPTPRRIVELPVPLELRALLAEFRGAPLAAALDLPAAHLASAMHTVALRESVLTFGTGPLALLGDACGQLGALPPGHGEVDVAAVARALPRHSHRAFVPWSGLHAAEVRLGYEGVAALRIGSEVS